MGAKNVEAHRAAHVAWERRDFDGAVSGMVANFTTRTTPVGAASRHGRSSRSTSPRGPQFIHTHRFENVFRANQQDSMKEGGRGSCSGQLFSCLSSFRPPVHSHTQI